MHEDDDILPGETRKLKIMYSGSCTSGDRIDIPASKISMTYNTENINGKIQTGIAPIISTCSGVDYNSTYTLEVGDYIQTISGTDFPGDLVELKLEDIVYLGSSGGIYQAKWQLGHEGVIQKVIIAGNNADLKEEFGSEYLNASTVVSNIQADGTYSADIQIV